jgi:hypothetical protein
MKQFFIIILALTITLASDAQNRYVSVAVINIQTEYPFGKFAGMFSDAFHPGIEAALGKNFSIKKKHDWFWDARVGYFFHRFVQHGIPIYANIGYRYKFKTRFSSDLTLGAGYMHSIPATAKLKLNEAGEYENNKGIGRMQANVCFGIGAGYLLNPENTRSIKVFVTYQQRLQMPFVKSYVPILPYNNFMIGVSKPIQKKK